MTEEHVMIDTSLVRSLIASHFPQSKELIGFRDYLRAHPEAVEEYAANIAK